MVRPISQDVRLITQLSAKTSKGLNRHSDCDVRRRNRTIEAAPTGSRSRDIQHVTFDSVLRPVISLCLELDG